MKNKFLLLGSWLMLGLLYANKTLAVLQSNKNPAAGFFIDFNDKSPTGVVLFLMDLLLGIAGSAAMLFIMIGGFYYVTSGANEELAKKGKSYLKNSIIGLIIIVLSYTIVSVVYEEFTTR